MEIGALARAARRARGWTQETAALEAGVSRQFVIALESGRHPNAELWRVLSVLSAVGATLSASFSDEVQEPAGSLPDPATRERRSAQGPAPSAVDATGTAPDAGSETEFDLDRHLAAFGATEPLLVGRPVPEPDEQSP